MRVRDFGLTLVLLAAPASLAAETTPAPPAAEATLPARQVELTPAQAEQQQLKTEVVEVRHTAVQQNRGNYLITIGLLVAAAVLIGVLIAS